MKESLLLDRHSSSDCVADLFETAFSLLRLGERRDEYVYKAALTHKILLGKHSLKTASMLNEFRVGPCKADLAILNGTATVYEIKSERDSLSRLERQILAYEKVFPTVIVIAGENHIDSVLASTPNEIGVLQLSKRHQISEVRKAVDRPDRVCPTTIFESVRTDEAKAILTYLSIEVARVPNTVMHAERRTRFEGQPARDVHVAMVKVLKRTRHLAPLSELVENLPQSLQPAALSTTIRRSDHHRLVSSLTTNLQEAMAWA